MNFHLKGLENSSKNSFEKRILLSLPKKALQSKFCSKKKQVFEDPDKTELHLKMQVFIFFYFKFVFQPEKFLFL